MYLNCENCYIKMACSLELSQKRRPPLKFNRQSLLRFFSKDINEHSIQCKNLIEMVFDWKKRSVTYTWWFSLLFHRRIYCLVFLKTWHKRISPSNKSLHQIIRNLKEIYLCTLPHGRYCKTVDKSRWQSRRTVISFNFSNKHGDDGCLFSAC